jgi:hypothetical protein
MSNHQPSMLIFGAEAAFRPRMPTGMEGSSRALVYEAGAGSSRVSVEMVAVNLIAVVEQMRHLIRAAQTAAGDLAVAHMDVNLGVAADGSVGLLGTDLKANARGTFTVRLVPRASMQSPAKECVVPAIVAINDDDAFRGQAP